jgi:hypothetical protein
VRLDQAGRLVQAQDLRPEGVVGADGFVGRVPEPEGLLRDRDAEAAVEVEVVERTGKGFAVIEQRWKVERTLAWLPNDRRHSRDDEVLTANSEAMIQISVIRLLLKRLA